MIDEKPQLSDAGDAAGLPPPLPDRTAVGGPIYRASDVERYLKASAARLRALEAEVMAYREMDALFMQQGPEVEALNETVTQGAAAYAEARRAIVALEAERDRLQALVSGLPPTFAAGLIERLQVQAREMSVLLSDAGLDAYQAREANCCPEDMGFDEVIKHLRAQLAELETERAALLPQWQPIESPPPTAQTVIFSDGYNVVSGYFAATDRKPRWEDPSLRLAGYEPTHWLDPRRLPRVPDDAVLAAGRSARPQLLENTEDTRGEKGVGSPPAGSTAPAD